ncbi:hypothetical protein KJ937_02475, partial [Patescibacteria group bacterium]|nr:hypothetical protein [Patescibacteria group bacterium]
MKYGELNLGQIEALVNKLGGMEGVRKFLRDELVVRELDPKELKPWQNIKLGTHAKDELVRELEVSDFHVSDWAKDMMAQDAFTVATEEIELELIVVTVAELGFKNGASFKQICERAKERGLELCPAEVGAQLRRQYQDQSYGEWLLIAMDPITASDGGLGVFRVGHGNGGFWLRSRNGRPGGPWDPDRH